MVEKQKETQIERHHSGTCTSGLTKTPSVIKAANAQPTTAGGQIITTANRSDCKRWTKRSERNFKKDTWNTFWCHF
jgi:hypothetical protein